MLSLSMDIGLSVKRFVLFHSRHCSRAHEITEGKASNLAFMHDALQQSLAKSNGLDDCESIGRVFHGFLRPIFMTASQSLTLRLNRFLKELLKALRDLRPLVWQRNLDSDAFADVVCVIPPGDIALDFSSITLVHLLD
jgi:hypothetical protein